jgi:hypothetical protein
MCTSFAVYLSAHHDLQIIYEALWRHQTFEHELFTHERISSGDGGEVVLAVRNQNQ